MTSSPADPPVAPRFDADGATFLFPARVYYEDTDFSGVVYHARYLHYLERGRSEFLRACGVTHAELSARADPVAFAVRRISVEFEGAARIDDSLVVATRFLAPSGVRFPIAQQIRRGESRVLSAALEVVCVTFDGRPRRPPPDLSHALAPRIAGAGF